MSEFETQLKATLQTAASAQRQDAKSMNQAISRVALSGLSTPRVSNPNATGVASIVDKAMAIKDIFDMQESCMMKFIVLGDLARTIREKQTNYDGDKIQIGFYKRSLTPEIKSLFTTWKFEETKYGYRYDFTPPIKWDVKIPVEIHVIQNKYKFFDNPDFGFFGVDDYLLPNPFEMYWKVRHFVK